MLIINTGTNDHGKNLNKKKLKKLVNEIKEIDKENDIEISFSGIIHLEDRNCKDVNDDTNKKL